MSWQTYWKHNWQKQGIILRWEFLRIKIWKIFKCQQESVCIGCLVWFKVIYLITLRGKNMRFLSRILWISYSVMDCVFLKVGSQVCRIRGSNLITQNTSWTAKIQNLLYPCVETIVNDVLLVSLLSFLHRSVWVM